MNGIDGKYLLAGLLIVLAVIGFYLFAPSMQNPSLEVEGSSVQKIMPDTAKIYLNVEARNKDAKSAKESLIDISDSLKESMEKLGMSDSLSFIGLNVYPEYDWIDGRRVDKGYVATQQIMVETGDFSKIMDVFDSSIESGAMFSYISFELSEKKESELKATALKEAGEDAERKAESIAQGLGKKVGKIISVRTSNYGYSPYRYDSLASSDVESVAKSSSIDVNPNEIEVSANLVVSYELI